MAYTATTDLSTLDQTKPVGSLEAVDILDDCLRETRRTFKTVITNKHTSTGDHKTGSIATAHLADAAVTAVKITDGTITAVKLAAGVLSGANVVAGSVDTTALKDLNVTTGKLADSAVTGVKIADTTITPAKLTGSGGAGRILVGQSSGAFNAVALSGGATIDATGLISLVSSLNAGVWADIQASNVAAQTFTGGAWNVRRLNSEVTDLTSIGALSSNTLTGLVAGTYIAIASAAASAAGGTAIGINALRLYNVTGAAVLVNGQSNNIVAVTESGQALLFGKFTLAATSTIQLEHWITGNSTLGGTPLNQAGNSENYCTLVLIRIV